MKNTETWVNSDVFLVDRVLKGSNLDSRPISDLVARDPKALIEAAKALIIEAVKSDAPVGVVEELIDAVRKMQEGAKNLPKFQYASDALAAVDSSNGAEIASSLESALEKAPDEANRKKLAQMVKVAKQGKRPVSEMMMLSADAEMLEASPHCIPCCALGCIVCVDVCPICCVAGCLLC